MACWSKQEQGRRTLFFCGGREKNSERAEGPDSSNSNSDDAACWQGIVYLSPRKGLRLILTPLMQHPTMVSVDMSSGLGFGSAIMGWFLYLCLVCLLFRQSGYFVMCLNIVGTLDHTLGVLVIWSVCCYVSVGSVCWSMHLWVLLSVPDFVLCTQCYIYIQFVYQRV
jgi:hypothetical protein